MAASTKAIKIGVIAEDMSDIDVMYEITTKLIDEKAFSFARFVGTGCGKLRRKCNAWARDLAAKGCSGLVVIHDLDATDTKAENALRSELKKKIEDSKFRAKVVLIPIQELEAWLLADPSALRLTFNMPKLPKLSAKPETINDPKEYLADLIQKNSKTRYVNTIHNKKIAKALAVRSLSRCPSFGPYPTFLKTLFP